MAVQITWTYKDIDNFYGRVRALLDNISDVSLPDKYIDMQEKAPFAESYAKARVPGWSTLNEDNFALFESAIIYKTASMFESLVNSNAIKKKELPTIKLEYFSRSQTEIGGMSLSDLADVLIASLSGDDGVDFIGFAVTQ